MSLTTRQREVLDYVRQVELQRGSGPTTREVQQHFGFKSQTAAVDHIRTLERKGALQKIAHKARAVTTSPPKLKIVHVPIFGSIPAGIPELIEQEPDGFISLDTVTAGVSERARLFATHVRGDSMIGAHVLDGDCAVFEVREPLPGQIVAALIDGETTLKRYVQEKGQPPFLRAENPAYPDLIPVNELVIQGVLVHLQRNVAGSRW